MRPGRARPRDRAASEEAREAAGLVPSRSRRSKGEAQGPARAHNQDAATTRHHSTPCVPHSPHALPRASAARLCSRPRSAGRCSPAEPAARVARPPRWHREPPHGRPPRARSHSTPPPPPPTRPARRAGERDAAEEEEEEAEAARSRRPGTGGTHHSAARRSGTRAGAPQRAAASGTHQRGGRLRDPRLHPEDARPERMELPGRRAVGVAPRDQEEAGTRAPCRPRAPPGRCLETDSSRWPGMGVALPGTDRALLGVHTP